MKRSPLSARGDYHIKVIIVRPLPEFCVGKLFPIDVAQARIAVRRASRLGHVDGEARRSDKYRSNPRENSCPFPFCKHAYRYRGTSRGRPHRAVHVIGSLVTRKLPDLSCPMRIPVQQQLDEHSGAAIVDRQLQEGFYNTR
jgi:hypothetical protein